MPKCPLCSTTNIHNYCKAYDAEYFTSKDWYNFYECTDCEIVFIDPMPVEKLATIYPANYYSFTDKNQSIAFKIKDWMDGNFYKKILKKIPGNQLTVLDIGGGTGTLLDTLQKIDNRVAHTLVVDIDSNAKSIAEQKGHQYFCGTIEKFETTQQYDVILMLNLIEHVEHPDRVLEKAAALLSVNGVIIIKTPNYKSLDARMFKNSYWGGLHCPRHWVIFCKKSFDALAIKNALSINYFSYTQGAPFWSFSILNWLHQRHLIKADKDRPIIYHPLFSLFSIAAAAFDFCRKPFAPLSQMFFVLGKKNN